MTVGYPRPGTSLALLAVPGIFRNDGLLDTRFFLTQARERGHDIDVETLMQLHLHGLLMPLFRIGGSVVRSRCVTIPQDATAVGMPGQVWAAAGTGRLSDPTQVARSFGLDYLSPETTSTWRGTCVFSTWQLLDLHQALQHRDLIRAGAHTVSHINGERRRAAMLALAALSPRYLADAMQRLATELPIQNDGFRRYRDSSPLLALLQLAGAEHADLRQAAARHLDRAEDCSPPDRMMHRAAAEVLLRAHRDLQQPAAVPRGPRLTSAASGASPGVQGHHRRVPRKAPRTD